MGPRNESVNCDLDAAIHQITFRETLHIVLILNLSTEPQEWQLCSGGKNKEEMFSPLSFVEKIIAI